MHSAVDKCNQTSQANDVMSEQTLKSKQNWNAGQTHTRDHDTQAGTLGGFLSPVLDLNISREMIELHVFNSLSYSPFL